jgi:hypothetical protein
MFNLPDNWEEFYIEMCTRAKKYIILSYWSISEPTLCIWLSNFKTNHEKFFSALLIYKIIYRNKISRISMYHDIVDIFLPNVLEENNIQEFKSLNELNNLLKSSPWSLCFKFTTITDVDTSPSKSGSQLLREFQREGRFHKKMQITLSEMENLSNNEKIKAIVIFDDIMGTGEQFETYLNKCQDYHSRFLFIYCPLVAHKRGMEYIKSKFPDVVLLPVEEVDDTYSFFDNSYFPKIAENIEISDLNSFYFKLIKEKTNLAKKDYYGKNKQALTYFFDLSTPNNTLPIFWYEKDSEWECLFPR